MTHSKTLVEDMEADLWRDGHEVTEEWRWDLPQLKHLNRGLHTHVDEQDVQHSTPMQVGYLQTEPIFDRWSQQRKK